jgi:putative membrane protein
MKNTLLSCLLFVLLFTSKQGNAQITSSTQIESLAKDTAAMNFVQKATLGNLKEIESGRLAQLRSENKDVIDFGKRMVADHTDASDLLSAILKNKKMNIPQPSLPIDENSKMLRNSKGEEFDKLYISMMLMDHQKTIDLFENALGECR